MLWWKTAAEEFSESFVPVLPPPDEPPPDEPPEDPPDEPPEPLDGPSLISSFRVTLVKV